MITNNSLKEYYVKMQELYDNAVNMLTGMSQSLSTLASEITVPIIRDNYITEEIRIPSFLYIENKLEELSTNFSNLFNMPNSGDAWLTNNFSQYKLQLIRANTAPIAPEFETSNIFASITDNNFLKDLVSPKTFLKINIDNLPLGTESMMMKKMIIYGADLYNALNNMNCQSYEEITEALFNYDKGVHYEEYNSELNMPCRRDKYKSRFEIINIPELPNEQTNPWTETSNSKLNYKLVLDTLTYFDKEDTSISFTLRVGDYLTLGNSTNVYKVKNVDTSDMSIIVEEFVGHTIIQTIHEDSEMVLQIYNNNYKEFDYIEVPLEENQFLIIFLGCVYNNVQSQWSKPAFFDLSQVLIKDEGGNYIQDEYGNNLSYLDYYEKYCTNIGDLILGLTLTAYPQVSNFSPSTLENIQNGNQVLELVNNSWDNEETLQVVPINKHLTDDVSSDEIMNLHAQKNELNSQLQTNQQNIDQVYNKLLTTDFSSQITITQQGLQEEMNSYYSDRDVLTKQLNSVVDAINTKALDVKVQGEEVKYRIRGITHTEELEKWLHETCGERANFISMEVQYKYKSAVKDTNTLNSINQSVFTDWNQQQNIERERYLVFGKNGTQGFGLEWVDYSSTANIIKWNQIDIPITSGEDVVIRIRYKYNIGQPFINIYTPWSSELTMTFPPEYQDDVELGTILDENSKDTIVAGYQKILIDEGYSEHIHNKMITNEQTFFHMPENIYSGFNTAENNLISLKDKLLDMNSQIETWRTLLDNESNSKFEIYIAYDDVSIQLTPNTINKINIYNSDHISNAFIKKPMNIVIKNTGNVRLNLYSLFPGNTNIPLIMDNSDWFADRIGDYDRVPIFINNELTSQYLGQWIYFRSNNPWTKEKIYYESEAQNNSDYVSVNSYDSSKEDFRGLEYTILASTIMNTNNKQSQLAYRERLSNKGQIDTTANVIRWSTLSLRNDALELYTFNHSYQDKVEEDKYNSLYNDDKTWYVYPLTQQNMFIMKYEDICGIMRDGNYEAPVYLDENTNIETFTEAYNPTNFKDVSYFTGAFLYPDLLSKELIMTNGGEKDSKFVEVGESLSIPIIFEYYCNNDKPQISKSLYFDIRNSLISDPKHFMIEIIGHNDYTASNEVYTNFANNIPDEASSPETE